MTDQATDYSTMTFEQLMERLEMLTGKMSSSEIGVEQVASMFSEAVEIHKLAGERLDAVAAQIDELSEELEEEDSDEDDEEEDD